MNAINTVGDGPIRETAGGLKRQTLNSGGTLPTDPHTARQQPSSAGALAICTTCDGTGWAHTATKGLTRCKGLGFPCGK